MGMEGEQAGLGERLRRAREEKGLSRADLSEELRLTQDKIRALEEEDFDSLPEWAFVRGYLRNYAAVVGISSDPLLAEYEQVQAQGQAEAEGEGRSERGKLIPEPERPIIEHPWRVAWVSLALLLVVTVVTLWLVGETRGPVLSGGQSPEGAPPSEGPRPGPLASGAETGPSGDRPALRSGEEPAPSSEEPAGADGAPEGPTGQPAQATGDGSLAGEGAGGTGQTRPDPQAEPGPAAPEQNGEDPVAAVGPGEAGTTTPQGGGDGSPASGSGRPSPAEGPQAPQAPGSETASGSPSSVLQGPSLDSDPLARAQGEAGGEAAGTEDGNQPSLPADLQALRIKTWAKSWMEVADARDRLLLRRLIPAGQDLRLYGQPPFDIKVGNAAGVQLYFQGKPLAPLGDPGQVVEVTVDGSSETVPESEVAPPSSLRNGAEG